MVDSGGGEGVNAYPMEYKMMTTIASSSSSPAWCHVADCDTIPLARCVVCGTGDAVCLSFPLVGVFVVFVVAGGRTRSSRARLLGIGRRLLAIVLFACFCRVIGWLASFWVAGIVCGGVGGVMWHAGDMEGTPCC